MSRNAALSSNTRLPVAKARRACLVVGFCTALSITWQGLARGQDVPWLQEAQTARTFAFDIAPQPLASALMAFGRQAGLQVVVDAPAVAGLSSGGLTATMSAERALQQMLAGSGLIYRFTNANTVAVERPGAAANPGVMQLDPVQVQGAFPVPSQAMIDNAPPPYAGGQVATGGQLGFLGNRGVMNTPFNQTNYTAKKAADQQAKTVQDVLIDDPSIRTIRTDSGVGSDDVFIRGFELTTADISYGGLYGILPTFSIMAELAERVEVLKGPNVMLNGMSPFGAVGGAINIVPKRAPNEPLTQLTAGYISGTQFGGHLDVARRFGPEQQFGVRLNGVFRDGQTDVRWNADERALGVLGLDFRGERARFSADFGYQYRNIDGVIAPFAVSGGVSLPWAPDARSNPTGQPWSFARSNDLFGVFRGEVDLTDYLTAYVSIGAHDNRFSGLYSQFARITDFNGNATLFTLGFNQYTAYRTAEGGVRAVVDTGPIEHQLAFTATTYGAENGFAFAGGPAIATNVYNPTVIARPSLQTPAANKASTTALSSLGMADTLSAANKRIQLTAGLRLQRVGSQNFDTTTGQPTTGYDQGALSPAVALVFKPWENVSIYGNWIQGLQQGTTVDSTFANAGEVLPPYKSTQYEVGVKADWGKFTTTANIFQITQPSTISIPGPGLPTLALNGEQRNQGLELNVFGEPTQGVRLLGGVTFLNPVLTKTQGGTTDGWIAPFSPQFNLNLSTEWDLPFVEGLTVTGRAIYTGSQYIDTTWPRRSLPEWTRLDLGARYAFENPGAKGKLLVARFNVENVLGANYWAGGSTSAGLFLSAPRSFRLSLSADF